jgi:hypothetical protein
VAHLMRQRGAQPRLTVEHLQCMQQQQQQQQSRCRITSHSSCASVVRRLATLLSLR